jgi:hypothetical protein
MLPILMHSTPIQYVDVEASPGDMSHEKKRIELELPNVMKLWRNRNSKYIANFLHDH